MKNNKKGFTLVELLVVIAIIAILVVLILVALGVARQKARDSQRKTDLRAVQTALELYAGENGNVYPDSGHAALETALNPSSGSKYLDPVPNDPLEDRSYGFQVDSTRTNYVLCATGERETDIFAGTSSDTTLRSSCMDQTSTAQ